MSLTGGNSTTNKNTPEIIMYSYTQTIQAGDKVVDPTDGNWRTITRVDGDDVYTSDGGTMHIDELEDVETTDWVQ